MWCSYGEYQGKKSVVSFLRYAISRFKKEQREMAFRIYITDSLYYARREEMIGERWIDLLNKKVDLRTGDEIARDIIKGAGLELKDECI